MMKRIFSLLLALSLLWALPLTAFAHDIPVDRDDCSIELIVRYDGKNVNGGSLTLVKIGHVEEEDGNYWFCRENDHVPMEDVQSRDAAASAMEFYLKNQRNYEFVTKTTEVVRGKAGFSDLSTGLYLVFQDKAAPGYTRLTPFLITVPYMEDGEYQYNVTVNVKSELEREPENTVTEPSKPSKLPQTGQMNWPVPVLCALGMAFIAVGFWLRCGRRKEDYEG